MKTRKPSIALAAIALGSIALQGCSTDNFATSPNEASYETTARPSQPTASEWHVVASEKFNPGVASVAPPLVGSRYTVTFSQNALSSAMTISMSERDPKIVDVKLDPDGITFGAPVTLTVNYSGTANDPDSPFFTGFAPKVRRWNPESGSWTDVPGSDNPTTKIYTAQLSGFSRYAMTDGMQSGGIQDGHTQRIQ